MNSKDYMKRTTEEYEADVKQHLELKLELLNVEESIKKTADFTPIDPDYEYENSEEWKEYLKEVSRHNIQQQRIAIKKQLRDLELNEMERRELEEKVKEGE